MNSYITGNTIKKLRCMRNMTQNQLAEKLAVSDKTISKWETGKGLPDITMIEPLAKTLNISISELISGEIITNSNISANMLKMHFYVCPICGNLITATGKASVSCCGIQLPPAEMEVCDDKHELNVEIVEDEFFVHINHEMTKSHYISFISLLTSDRIETIKLYPEGNAEARFKIRYNSILLGYCNKHGLFYRKLKR